MDFLLANFTFEFLSWFQLFGLCFMLVDVNVLSSLLKICYHYHQLAPFFLERKELGRV